MGRGQIAACLLATLSCACATTQGPARADSVSPAAAIPIPKIQRPQQESATWWFRAGGAAAHNNGAGRERATNVILFVGDGMSLPTVAAARIFEGQRQGKPGEENQLSFEKFSYTAFSKTYNTDSQTPDSAGTMTAMISGVKTRIGVLSTGPEVALGDCAAALNAPLVTALELAEAAGLSTGIVTTTRITHATPAATYAHSPNRNWESDSDLPPNATAAGCRDIARQFAEFDVGNGIEVAMGGGRSNFLVAGEEDPEYPEFPGNRLDGRNLINEWQKRYPEGSYVWNQKQLAGLNLATTPRLLGLFEPDHMNFEHDRVKDRAGEPSLAEMTRAAITVLKQNPKGFFLMVEGGRIDHAHHAGNAYRALTDTIAYSDAIRVATEATSSTDTLILVTADHSHTMSFVGYPQRGNPILGKVVGSSGEDKAPGLAVDALGLPYTTLSYANGPGYSGATDQQEQGPKRFPHSVSGAQAAPGRLNLREVNTEDPDYLQESAMPAGSETHGGDDVGVWASGPGAAAVHGSIEQNVIFHLLMQSQPAIVDLLCAMGDCENGVPLRLPSEQSLRSGAKVQAR
jgi:alkaline phosphatase